MQGAPLVGMENNGVEKATASINNSAKWLDTLQSLCNNLDASDVKIKVKGDDGTVVYFHASSFILSASCPFLKGLCPFNEVITKEVDLSQIAGGPTVLPIILQYLYTGRCSFAELESNPSCELLLAALHLQLAELAEGCTNWLIEDLSVEKALRLLREDKSIPRRLKEKVLAVLLEKFEEIAAHEEQWKALPQSVVQELLCYDDIQAPEIKIWHALLLWLEKDATTENKREQMKRFRDGIRPWRMTPKEQMEFKEVYSLFDSEEQLQLALMQLDPSLEDRIEFVDVSQRATWLPSNEGIELQHTFFKIEKGTPVSSPEFHLGTRGFSFWMECSIHQTGGEDWLGVHLHFSAPEPAPPKLNFPAGIAIGVDLADVCKCQLGAFSVEQDTPCGFPSLLRWKEGMGERPLQVTVTIPPSVTFHE